MAARIGIFGGTFDPPHLGHLILAAEARAALDLSRVLWVLTFAPPHKLGQPMSPEKDRLSMLTAAISEESGFELSTVEMERPGPHYTVDTMRLLASQYPGAEMILLLGGDSLRDLPTWHQPAALVAMCHEIGVMRRPGDAIELSALESKIPGLTARLRYMDAPLLEISSHEIRRRVAAGMPYRYYVPPAVFDYIRTHGLYRKP